MLDGNETSVWGDQGYQGQSAVIHEVVPNAKDFTNRRYRFNGRGDEIEKAKNRNKSRVRAKVEHVFGVMKNFFGFREARYLGLAKNLNRLEATAALTNLCLARRRLLNAAETCRWRLGNAGSGRENRRPAARNRVVPRAKPRDPCHGRVS